MHDFATIDEHDTVTLERDLPGPIERVWAFLTEPALLARWFSGGVFTGRVGGAVNFEMGADGVVTAYEPPRLLEYTWNERDHSRGPILDTVVRWELAPAGDRVRLTLTHARLGHVEALNHGAGWDTFVERLTAVLDGREPGADVMARFRELQRAYAERFGVALAATE